jgi:hypothetical protein
MRFQSSVLITLAAMLAGCSRGPAKISLSNRSSVTISNVCVSGEHFAQPLGSLTPGMSMSFALDRPSADDVWVTFESDGQSFDSRGKSRPDFFAVGPGHPLSLTIGADLKVLSSLR